MKTSEALENAAAYIAENGWCQNAMQMDDGRVCALGAIQKVVKAHYLTFEYDPWAVVGQDPYSSARMALCDHLGYLVPTWNDAPETTAEEVILTMKTVAYELAENGQ